MNIFFLREWWAKTKLIFKKRKPDPFVTSNRSEAERAKHMSTWWAVKIRGAPMDANSVVRTTI